MPQVPSSAPGPVDPLALVDRPAVLELLGEVLGRAWSSFDAPRPAEPELPPVLARSLTGPLPQAPGDPATALADAARVLDASVSPSRPLFLAYVGSTGLEIGVLGAALTAAYDVNMAVSAGAVGELEAQALSWVADFLGYPAVEGAFTSGGMLSNLTALIAAREAAVPGSRTHGVRSAVGIYCSAEAHHSNVRAVEVAGLGSASVRRIGLDERRAMRPEALDAALRRDRDEGVVPLAVIATAGTTLTGAIDPLGAVADVCERHGVWLHVDGAYGLPAVAAPSTAHLFAGLDRADSVTVDAHKWLGVQKSCSLVLLRREALRAAFHHDEEYMVHRDGAVNPVDGTLEYSRPVRSVGLWLALRTYGADAFRTWIEHTLELARDLADQIRADPDLELLHEPELSTLCFRHTGAADLDTHNARLAAAIVADGRVRLADASLDGQTCLRVCVVNFRTRPEDLALLLDVVRELAATID